MKNGKAVTRTNRGQVLAVILTLSLTSGVGSAQGETVSPASAPQALIQLDAAQNGMPEMPSAIFRHDVHVAAANGDCLSCHASLAEESSRKTFRFVADNSRESWHSACLTCHTERKKGPVAAECQVCHAKAAPPQSERLPVYFDRSLHAVHVQSGRIPAVQPQAGTSVSGKLENCGRCHQTVDKQTGKSVYIPGTEEGGFFADPERSGKNPLTRRQAAHEQCVTCHIESMSKAGNDGENLQLPVACVDCHSAAGQGKFPKVANAPRLLRGQPDKILLKKTGDTDPAAAAAAASRPSGLPSVEFDHKRHEEKLPTCVACHQNGIGKEDANGVRLVQKTGDGRIVSWYDAMHSPELKTSCAGCHKRIMTEEKNCSSCHAGLKSSGAGNCAVCHSGAGAEGKAPAEPLQPGDIPEQVVIDALSSEYEAVTLPHRKIYQILRNGVVNNGLAQAFHTAPETICAGCHHNIPKAELKNPPKCASCHDVQVSRAQAGRLPSLKHAYHQQCMDCHKRMDVKPVATDCAGCHVRKNVSTTQKGQEVAR